MVNDIQIALIDISWERPVVRTFCKGSHIPASYPWRPSHYAYFDRIRNSMKIQNALVSNLLDRWQRYFAHVTTVTLSWRVQNIVVIGHVYFTLECFEFSSNFEFDRNMLSGTGAIWRHGTWSLVLIMACYSTTPGVDPITHKTSYRKISQNIESPQTSNQTDDDWWGPVY